MVKQKKEISNLKYILRNNSKQNNSTVYIALF